MNRKLKQCLQIRGFQVGSLLMYLRLTTLMLITNHCGPLRLGHHSGQNADAVAEAQGPTSTDAQVSTDNSGKQPAEIQSKIQLSDEAIGVKTGAQLIAHYSFVTGIQLKDFDKGQVDALIGLKKSLPEKNSLEAFSSAHPPAAIKVATYYCQKLIELEVKFQDGAAGSYTAKLPPIDYKSQKPLSVEVARIFYQPLILLFAGQGTETLPDPAKTQAILDDLINSIRMRSTKDQNLGAQASVLGLCVGVAASFSSLWL